MNAAFPKTRNFKHSGTKEKDFSGMATRAIKRKEQNQIARYAR